MRTDRDSGIRVVWENLNQNYVSQFSKMDTDSYGVPYNYGSVMQYSSKVSIWPLGFNINLLKYLLMLFKTCDIAFSASIRLSNYFCDYVYLHVTKSALIIDERELVYRPTAKR